MADPWDILKRLADPTRLRLLHLLSLEELTVAELQDILEMGQSRISSHLAILRQADLVLDRRDGKRSWYALRPDLPPAISQLVQAAFVSIAATPAAREDARLLDRVLAKRRQTAEQYFNAIAGRFSRRYCPGRSWEAFGHFLLFLTPRLRIADLGAGEGMIGRLLARHSESVVCLDSSPRMVEVGAEQAARLGLPNLTFLLGDIEKIPLPEADVDIALLSQALHHASRPALAVAEAFRILRPGGRLVILDLRKHDFEKARELYADTWLGFSPHELHDFLLAAGFSSIEVHPVHREPQEPHFVTLLATGLKPTAPPRPLPPAPPSASSESGGPDPAG